MANLKNPIPLNRDLLQRVLDYMILQPYKDVAAILQELGGAVQAANLAEQEAELPHPEGAEPQYLYGKRRPLSVPEILRQQEEDRKLEEVKS